MIQKGLLILMTVFLCLGCQREKIVEDQHGIFKTKLKNGLTVIIKESHASKVVTVLTQVKAGYFNEPDAWAGISHLLEHMYFKGTEKRSNPNDIHIEAQSYGAKTNAWTYYDQTGYYLTLPSKYFEQALELQADGISNMKVDPTELSKETEVVIQEGKRKKDNPAAMTQELLKKLAFKKHRLKRWRIGQDKDLRKITRNNVMQYYGKYYKANNMILTVVGDINAREALKAIRRHYETIPSGEVLAETSEAEPQQKEFRYKQKWADIKSSYLNLGFHTPEMFHADSYALDIIEGLLNWGRSSRLKKTFKAKNIIVSNFSVNSETFKDIGFFTIQARLDGEKLLDAEMTILSELERLKHEPVKDSELKKIQNLLETKFYMDQESTWSLAKNLSQYEQYGDYRLYQDYLKKLFQVTPHDIQRVAKKYFTVSNASLFEYVSRFQKPHRSSKTYLERKFKNTVRYYERIYKSKNINSVASKQAISQPSFLKLGSTKVEKEKMPLKRYQLSNSAILLLKKTTHSQLMAVNIYFKGGRLHENKSNSGITHFLLKTSLKGTTTKSSAEISRQFDQLGIKVSTVCEPDFFGYRFMVLKRNLDAALRLMSDVIVNPSFQNEVLKREKKLFAAKKKSKQDHPRSYTFKLFKEAAFKNHPYGNPKLGIKKVIQRLTADQLLQWQAKSINAKDMVISVVGDFNPLDIRASMETYFKMIPPRNFNWPEIAEVQLPSFISENFKVRRKEQTAILIGFQAVSRDHPDYYALKVMQGISSGLSGRFGIRLRSKEKLAYTVKSSFQSYLKGGVFTTYTATSPNDEKKALRYLLEEYKKIRDEAVTREELSRAKNAIIGQYFTNMEAGIAKAHRYAKNEIYGKPPQVIDEFADNINGVTVSELSRVALKYFNLEKYTLGVVRGKSKAKSIISKPVKPIVIPEPKVIKKLRPEVLPLIPPPAPKPTSTK